ncbi:MAG TPA: murein transglycosylase [Cryomorphaceae bacterium]|nr:murein transglycosylase [Cryomorphaceae bacterium]
MKNNILNAIIGASVVLVAVIIVSSSIDDVHPAEARPSTVKPFKLPKEMSIAGEDMPLDRLDVQESLDREILVNSYWQSNNLLMLKRSDKWFPVIAPIFASEGIPEDFKYLALIESGLQNIISPAGAAGPWQIMKATGLEAGLIINSEVDERYQMEKATRAACAYLKEAYELFGNWTLAAASYNMGMAGTGRRLQEQKVNSYYDLRLNSETARYVFRWAAVKHIHENLDEYGYVYHQTEGYKLPAFDTIQVQSAVVSWVDWAQEHGMTYKELRLYNPWIRSSKLTNSSNNTYAILVAK